MTLTEIEQKLANLANTVIDAAANMVAANNPAYTPLIALGASLVDGVNQQINPSAQAATATIHATATALSAAVAPVEQAASTVASSTAEPIAKATAIQSVITEVESIVSDIKDLF